MLSDVGRPCAFDWHSRSETTDWHTVRVINRDRCRVILTVLAVARLGRDLSTDRFEAIEEDHPRDHGSSEERGLATAKS